MGYEEINGEGYDFNYSYLSTEAQKSYFLFLKEKLQKELKEQKLNEENISFKVIKTKEKAENGDEKEIEKVEVFVKGEILDKDILNKIHKEYLQYYEMVLNKDRIEFYELNKLVKEIYTNHTYSMSEIMNDIVHRNDNYVDIKNKLDKHISKPKNRFKNK